MKKVLKVYKYGTGQEIPKGAIYLSTQTETITAHDNDYVGEVTRNLFVWHYFLVEVIEKGKNV